MTLKCLHFIIQYSKALLYEEDNMKQYKLVAGPTSTQILGKKADNNAAVANFQQIISSYAQQGWSYHSMEAISTEQEQGCLFNKHVVTMTFYMLIFVHEA